MNTNNLDKALGAWLQEIEIREGVSGYELAPMLGLSGHNYYGKYRHNERQPTTFQRRLLELIDHQGVDIFRRRITNGMIFMDGQVERRMIDGEYFLSCWSPGGIKNVPEYNMRIRDIYQDFETKRLIDTFVGSYDGVRYSYYQIMELLGATILDLWRTEAEEGKEPLHDELISAELLAWLEKKMELMSQAYTDDSATTKIIEMIQMQLVEIHKYSEKNIAFYRKAIIEREMQNTPSLLPSDIEGF